MSSARSIVIPVALTVSLALFATIFFATRGEEDEPEVQAPALEPVASVEEPSDEPAPPTAEPSPTVAPEPAARAPSPAAEPPAATPTPAPAPEETQTPEPLPPELHRHAKLMVVGTAQSALDRADIDQLEEVIAFSEDENTAVEQLVPKTDLEAARLGLACLKGAPDAQKAATAFLQFGPRSQLDDGLRKACWEKLGQGQEPRDQDSPDHAAEPAHPTAQ